MKSTPPRPPLMSDRRISAVALAAYFAGIIGLTVYLKWIHFPIELLLFGAS